MSQILKKEEVLSAFMNPVISRQVTQIIKQNAMGFVLEPLLPEFADKKNHLTKNPESKSSNKTGTANSKETQGPVDGPQIGHLDSVLQNEQNKDLSAKDVQVLENNDSSVKQGEDSKGAGVLPIQENGESVDSGKIWIVIKAGTKLGPFTSEELTVFVQESPDQQRMLIKNNLENRILTVEFYLKEYLPGLANGPQRENGNSRNEEDPSESESLEVDNASFEDIDSGDETNPTGRINDLPEEQAQQNGQSGEWREANFDDHLQADELTEAQNMGYQTRDPRNRVLPEAKESRNFNMFTGNVTGPELDSNRNVYEGASGAYSDNRMFGGYASNLNTRPPFQTGLGKYSDNKPLPYPSYQQPGNDQRDTRKPQSHYESAIKTQVNAQNRPGLDPTKNFRPQGNPYSGYEQQMSGQRMADPRMTPEHNQVNTGYGYQDTGYYNKEMQSRGQSNYEFKGPSHPTAKPLVNNPILENLSENRSMQGGRLDMVTKIEEDPKLDSLTNPYFLINELTKRNQLIRNGGQINSADGTSNKQEENQVSHKSSFNNEENYSGKPAVEEFIGNEIERTDSRKEIESELKPSSQQNPVESERKDPRNAYINNIKSINKQTTLDTPTLQQAQPKTPLPQMGALRPAMSEPIYTSAFSGKELENKVSSSQNGNNPPSSVNSYMQNIMKINKKQQEAQLAGSLGFSQNDLANLPPIQQSRLQEPPNRVNGGEGQSGAVNSDEKGDDRPNKFIEQVFHSKDLRKLKEKGQPDLKLENIFEKDVIMIPPTIREHNNPKTQSHVLYQNNNMPLQEDQNPRGGPHGPKQPIPNEPRNRGDGYDPYHPQRPTQPMYPETNQRFPQGRPPYAEYEQNNRPNQGYPNASLNSKQHHATPPNNYPLPPYDPGFNQGQKYNQDYPSYRQGSNYQQPQQQPQQQQQHQQQHQQHQQFQPEYDIQPEFGKYPSEQQGYPPRGYQNKQEYNQYDYGRQYDPRQMQNRKPQYPVEPQNNYGYSNAPLRGQFSEYPGYKPETGQSRYNYGAPTQQQQPPQPANYRDFDESYNPYSTQRGYSQFEAPRPSGPQKFGGGYPGEHMQPNKYKGQGFYGSKNNDQESSSFYESNADDRNNLKSNYQKGDSFKNAPSKNQKGKKSSKKKDSEGSYYQNKQGNQSQNESGY